MREVFDFLRLLYRHKITLIAVPLVTAVAAFFIVRALPDAYTAHARLATGIVDQGESLLEGSSGKDQASVSQEFDNLIQLIRLKKIVTQVSYRLVIHDLTSGDPFRDKEAALHKLGNIPVDSAVALYTRKYNSKEEISSWNKKEKPFLDVLAAMKYDESSLSKNLSVYRVGNSDFIDLEYTSENPVLSAFILNTLSREFIGYHTSRIRESNTRTVRFLDSLLRQKQAILGSKMETLKGYKIRNRVLNLNEQAKSLYGQIADFETRREVAGQEIVSYTAALKGIDSKFKPSDRRYLESAVTGINQDIVTTREQLRNLNDAYIRSGFDSRYKIRVDSLRQALSGQISEAGDRYIYSPLAAKENLVLQKLNMEVSLELAQNSVRSIDDELVRLNRKFDSLVPHEAEIQAFESGIDIAGKEYIEILQKFNQASMISGIPLQLRQIEQADPGELQASRKLIMVIFAGILSFVLCVGVLFILYLMDHAVRDAGTLQRATGLPVLGSIELSSRTTDPATLWAETGSRNVHELRHALRSIRFALEESGMPGKTLVVTSLFPGESKTVFAHNLAWAFQTTRKNVLLIDSDHTGGKNPEASYLEEFLLHGSLPQHRPGQPDILINRMADLSLPEITSKTTLAERLDMLRNRYDVIVIATAPLTTENNAREWISFADRVIGVFNNGETITEARQREIDYLTQLGPVFAGWVWNS